MNVCDSIAHDVFGGIRPLLSTCKIQVSETRAHSELMCGSFSGGQGVEPRRVAESISNWLAVGINVKGCTRRYSAIFFSYNMVDSWDVVVREHMDLEIHDHVRCLQNV